MQARSLEKSSCCQQEGMTFHATELEAKLLSSRRKESLDVKPKVISCAHKDF